VGNENGDNELQITLLRVKKCLKKAVLDNKGEPVSFHKFAIDPFSLTFTIENLFHLASLVKDGFIKIEKVSGCYILYTFKNNLLFRTYLNSLLDYLPTIFKIMLIYYF